MFIKTYNKKLKPKKYSHLKKYLNKRVIFIGESKNLKTGEIGVLQTVGTKLYDNTLFFVVEFPQNINSGFTYIKSGTINDLCNFNFKKLNKR